MSNDYYRIETELGAFVAWRNSSSHVGVRTENTHGRYAHNAPAGGWDGIADHITFGSSEYTVSDHLTLEEDGTVSHYDNGLSRPIMSGRWNDAPAPTHLAKWRKVIEAAVLEWVATPEGHRAGLLADVESATRSRDYAQRDLAELDAKREELHTELMGHQSALEAARKALEADMPSSS